MVLKGLRSELDKSVLVYSVNSSPFNKHGRIQDLVWGGGRGEIRQGDLRVLLLLSQMFMESMMQEN